MSDDKVKLPGDVEGLLEEVKKLEKKHKEATALGADAAALGTIKEALSAMKSAVVEALVADAQAEMADGAKNAKKVVADAEDAQAGLSPDAAIPLSEDQQRIKDAEEEIKRIREKMKKAQKLGAGAAQINGLEADLKGMKRRMRDAVLAAARRERDELRKELNRIRRGLPKPGAKNGPGGGKPVPPKTGGKGSGPGSGGGAIPAGIQPGKAVGETIKTTEKAKDPLTIYVQSKDTVWAWSAHDAKWYAQKFSSDLVKVSLITGGILAISAHSAALWDTYLSRWLKVLDVPADALTDGEAS